jgi:hypothetical protein
MTQRKISDAVRAIEMMVNNARMPEHCTKELRRIAQELREIDDSEQKAREAAWLTKALKL